MINYIGSKDKYIYFMLIILAIMFVTFDLIASSAGQLVMTLIFSSITLIITFIGSHKSKAIKIDKGIDTTIDFINSNFNNPSKIFSIIDVLCCIIALMTGVFYIAIISRVGIAISLAVKINKYRTVAFTIWAFVFGYLIKRREKMEEKKDGFIITILKWLWANKKSICGTIFGVVAGVITAIVANADIILELPELMLFGFNMTAVIIGVLVFAGIEIGVAGKGFETILKFTKRKEIQSTEKQKADKEAKLAIAKKKVEEYENAKKILEENQNNTQN